MIVKNENGEKKYYYTEEEFKDLEDSYFALKDMYDSVYQFSQELNDMILKLRNLTIGEEYE